MKKFSLVIGLLAAFVVSANAQEFKPGVYLQLQGGAAYDIGEAPFINLISPTAQVGLGYRFSPVFGTRLTASGWVGRNYTSGTDNLYKYRFVEPALDFQFDLASLFKGYRAGRVTNPYWFVGGGAAIGLDNTDAINLARTGDKFSLLWEPTKVFWAVRTGFGIDFRLSDHVAFNIEVNGNMYPDTFNSKQAVDAASSPDFRINALAGFTFRFGRKARKVAPAVVPGVVTYNQVKETPAEEPRKPERETAQPDNGPAIYQGADVDIFFDLGKAVIRQDQQQTMNRLVSFLRVNPDAKVKLDGYADRDTGTTEINQDLSEQRVAAVRQYLVSRGIDPARIATNAHGDTVQPFSGAKNRVVTCRIR